MTGKSLVVTTAAAGSVAGGVVLAQSEPEKKDRDRRESSDDQVINPSLKLEPSNKNNSLETNNVETPNTISETNTKQQDTQSNTISTTTPEKQTPITTQTDTPSQNDVVSVQETSVVINDDSIEELKEVESLPAEKTDEDADKSQVSELGAPKDGDAPATDPKNQDTVKDTAKEATPPAVSEDNKAASEKAQDGQNAKSVSPDVPPLKEPEAPTSPDKTAQAPEGTEATKFLETISTQESGSAGKEQQAQAQSVLRSLQVPPPTISNGQSSLDNTGTVGVKLQEQLQPPVLTKTPPKFSALLSFSENFYDDFNKPGDCIKKMFPGYEKYSVFKSSDNLGVADQFSQKDDEYFSASNTSFACYTFNQMNNEKVRLEFAFTNGTNNWIWMSGIKPVDGNKKIWFKEISFYKGTDGGWKTRSSQEGEIDDTGSDFFNYLNDWGGSFVLDEVDAETQQDCKNVCSIKARLGYFKYGKGGEKIEENFPKFTDQIISLKDKNKRENIYSKANIKRLWVNDYYGAGKWYKPYSPQQTASDLNLNTLKTNSGSWINLVGLCEDSTSSKEKGILCK